MKKKVLLVIFLVTAAAVAGTMTRSAHNNEGEELSTQANEIRQSYQLQPGAQVQVANINGSVEIETTDTDTAEIYVQRTARNPEELNRRKIIIEHTPTSLSVRAEQASSFNFWNWWGKSAGERVVLKVPRKIDLVTKGVNGKVTVGEVDGMLQVKGINGKVEIAEASGYTDVSGTNGPISVTVKQLGERGLRISGINGGVELRLHNGLNADLQAKGMNGGVSSDVPGVVVQKDERSKFSARIGAGGAPIAISGINGSVRLTSDTNSSAKASQPENREGE